MADRWLDDHIEIELNKPLILTRLLDQGFEKYGYQGSNDVYKSKDDLVLYNPYQDEVVCKWNLNDLMEGLESE